MALDHFVDWLSQQGNLPNRPTTGMGELVRRARLEAGLSQAELAKLIHRRQAALSDIENGKIRVDTETIVYLATNLNKPVSYFFPERLVPRVSPERISIPEQELLLLAKQLNSNDLKRLIAIARALVNLDERNAEADFEESNVR